MGRVFLGALLRELSHLARSKWDLALSTLFPATILVLMGVLFLASTMQDLPLVLVDRDHSALSRDAARMLDATSGTRVAFTRDDLDAAWPLVRSGKAYGVFYVPSHAERDIKAGRKTAFVLYTAPSYYTTAVSLERDAGHVVEALGVQVLRADVARADLKRVQDLPVAVQLTTLFNPGASYELMIVSLLHPAILVILMSCAVVAAIGREFSGRNFSAWIRRPRDIVPAFCGKMLPYLLVYLAFGAVSIAWLAWGRGYPVAGSVLVLMLGYLLMLIAYVLLAAAIIAVARDATVALGSVAVYASSAMAFSGAFFPMIGAPWFTRSWNAIQPYTWYSQISAEAWQMGAPASASLGALSILLFTIAVLALGTWAGLRWACREAERGTL